VGDSPFATGQTCFLPVNRARVHWAIARFVSSTPINQTNARISATHIRDTEPKISRAKIRDGDNLNEIHRNIAPNAALV
jgi:hypothetical protein